MENETVTSVAEEYLQEEITFANQGPDIEQPLEGTGWRLAKSLVTLRDEVNKKAPNRSKVSDGTIGNSSHAAGASRHNPNNYGVVCAMDITHDPSHGMDTYALFDFLRTHQHKDLEYVISNRKIASRTRGWVVRAYTGSSPHTEHIHIAVGRGPDSEPRVPYDDTSSWGIAKLTPAPIPFPYGARTLKLTTPPMSGADVLWCQQQINKLHTYPQNVTQHLKEDSKYGPETAKCIDVFQFRYKLTQDSMVGPKTWYELRKQTNNL